MTAADHLAVRQGRHRLTKEFSHGLTDGGEYRYLDARAGREVEVRCRAFLRGRPRLSWWVVDLREGPRSTRRRCASGGQLVEVPGTERLLHDDLRRRLY